MSAKKRATHTYNDASSILNSSVSIIYGNVKVVKKTHCHHNGKKWTSILYTRPDTRAKYVPGSWIYPFFGEKNGTDWKCPIWMNDCNSIYSYIPGTVNLWILCPIVYIQDHNKTFALIEHRRNKQTNRKTKLNKSKKKLTEWMNKNFEKL